MIYNVVAVILFLITLAIDLKIDIAKWKIGKTVNHYKKWIRGFGLIPVWILASLSNLWLLLPILFLILFLYWFLFDGLYNKFRKFGWWFTGTDDPEDSKTDNFLQKLKLWQHIAIKIGGILISGICYYYMVQ